MVGLSNIGFAKYFSIRHHFDNCNFDDPILRDIGSRCFKIKNAKRIAKIEFHETSDADVRVFKI